MLTAQIPGQHFIEVSTPLMAPGRQRLSGSPSKANSWLGQPHESAISFSLAKSVDEKTRRMIKVRCMVVMLAREPHICNSLFSIPLVFSWHGQLSNDRKGEPGIARLAFP